MSGPDCLVATTWPLDQAYEAIAALAAARGLAQPSPRAPLAAPPPAADVDAVDRWLAHLAVHAGVELEAVDASLADLDACLASGGPLLVRVVDAAGKTRLAALRDAKRGQVHLLGPDRALHRRPLAALKGALCGRLEAPERAACERLLDAAGVPARRRPRALARLLRGRLATRRVAGLWIVRPSPASPLAVQARDEGLGRWVTVAALAHLAQIGLLLLAWWIIGGSILAGRADAGWLAAWALVLATMIPLRLIGAWSQGKLALLLGGWLKRRLLVGALTIDPDVIRSRGGGQLLAQVYEAEAAEALALRGLLSLSALIDLAMAAWVLAQGAAGGLHVALLVAWTALVLRVGLGHARTRMSWARERLAMTQDLVERMVGHATRLVQETPEHWHDEEARATGLYLERSAAMDRRSLLLTTVASRGWLVLGIVGLWPALVTGEPGTGALAIAFGGVLLALHAFVGLAGGLRDLTDLWISWREVAPLAAAAARCDDDRPRHLGAAPPAREGGNGNGKASAAGDAGELPLIEARGLTFRYPARERPVLAGCDLRVRVGERLLLEGASGGGKSTLASLVIGLRRPDAGLLLLEGLDRATHGGPGWRARVAAAPQFHDNHVLTGTFAFNLLMGRRWPPTPEDFALAESICGELGLGPLLGRMPAGMMQIVGESGWQLSHGERSRLFLARALLQGARLVVLDESLAALDPDNQARALACAFERAPTLLVIAHP